MLLPTELRHLLDDESYFTLTNSEINENVNLYSRNFEFTLKEFKFKTKDKFEDKLLVYVIISSLGVSRTHKTPSGIVIIRRLFSNKGLPCIRNLPENTQYIFWPAH